MKAADNLWQHQLNPEQLRAVNHDDGPLLIVAGAGTGKTMTLVGRLAHLISKNGSPDRMMLLTFTRRAAEDMVRRCAGLLPVATNQIWAGTFHSMANRLLRTYGVMAGLDTEFTIIDRSDAEDLLDLVRNDLGLTSRESRFPRKSTCLAIYSQAINGAGEIASVLNKQFPWCADKEDELRGLFKEYSERKQRFNVLDYDDLLLYWYYLLDDEQTAEHIGGRFDHILVDEYQDTNTIQSGILIGMRRDNPNITAVGDDAQSIYSFRAATVRNMLDFPDHFPGATVIKLEQNYRSVQPILDTSNLIIVQAENRHRKELWSTRGGGQLPELLTCADEAQQDDEVISRVLAHYEQGIALRKQAVLFRTGSHSNYLEIELARRNIPFRKYGGLKFLEASHVKDMISFLRILENPRDELAWFRVLQLISGIGPATAASLYRHLVDIGYSYEALESFREPEAAQEEFAGLRRLLVDLSSGLANPSTRIERIISFYRPLLERLYDNPEPRLNDLLQLAHLASRYTSTGQFLAELTLDPPSSTGDLAGQPTKDEDWLVLSTIHSAKGLEWDVVYLIHAADGFLPADLATGSAEEIEEELRLTYVAMTRARDFLYVTWPLRYHSRVSATSDHHGFAQLCRFFTNNVRGSMREAAYGAQAPVTTAKVSSRPMISIADRVNSIWGK